MTYVYCALIAWGVCSLQLAALVLIARRLIRPLIAPLKGMRIAVPRPPIISGDLEDKPD